MRLLTCCAALLLLVATAGAAPLTVSVAVRDEQGGLVPVSGARVAVVPADQVVNAEQVVTLSPHATDATGRVAIERPAGRLVVLAGIALRGFAFAWLSPDEDQAQLILPKEAVLKGFVVDQEGSPVPGAEVWCAPERASDTGDFLAPGSILFKEYSAGDGSFRFLRLPSGHRYRIRAAAPGFVPSALRDREIREEPALLKLGRGAVVRGLVILAPGGEGVAGALVELSGVATRTDEQGVFELRAVPPGAGRLTVKAAGRLFENREELVLEEGGLREGIVVRVISLGRLKGRVLTPATTPAEGAVLFLRYPQSADLADRLPEGRLIRAGETDAEGKFDLTDLIPAQGVDLIVVHPDYAPTIHFGYSIVAGRSFDTIVLLRPGGAVSGRVLGAEGRSPIEGAEVIVLDHGEDPAGILTGERGLSPTTRRGLTDAEGAYLVENIDPGKKTVLVRIEGRLPGLLSQVEVAPGLTRRGLLVFLGAGSRIVGRVNTTKGTPVPNAVVSLVPAVGPAVVRECEADGSFSAVGIPAGAYEIHVTADGFVPFSGGPVASPAEDVVVILRRGEGLPGTVRASETGEPVGGAMVRALRLVAPSPLAPNRRRFHAEAQLRADPEEGRFAFVELPPGEYRLEAWSENGQFGFIEPVIVAPDREAEPVSISIESGWAVIGRVISGRNGRPVEGALVSVRNVADEPGAFLVTTDSAGQFRLEGVPAGFHSLVVTASDHAATVVPSVEVRDASVTDVGEIMLRGGAAVRGLVRAADGAPRAGLAISMSSAEHGGTLGTVTDEQGAFAFEHVPAGQWLLEFEDLLGVAGGRRVERLILVPDSGEVELLIGTGQGASLTGRVTSSGLPQAHARIQAMLLAGPLAHERALVTTTADAEGYYLLADLVPGEYLLLVTPSGSTLPPARFKATLPPGPVTIRDLVLPDSGVEVRVEALETGDPVAGVRVVLSREAPGAAGTFLESLAGVVGETTSNQDGVALFPAVEPGSYRLIAFASGFGQGVAAGIRVISGGLTPVRVALPEGGAVRGRVLDRSGRAVSSARVAFQDAAGVPATSPEFLPVNSDGRFRVDSLRSGRYRLVVTAPGYARTTVEDIEVFPGGSPEVEVQIGREGRVLVTVYGPGGTLLPGARLSVMDFWGHPVNFERPGVGLLAPFSDPATAGKEGTVLISGLPAGIYTVNASLEGYQGAPSRVQVLDGELSRSAVVLLPVEEGR